MRWRWASRCGPIPAARRAWLSSCRCSVCPARAGTSTAWARRLRPDKHLLLAVLDVLLSLIHQIGSDRLLPLLEDALGRIHEGLMLFGGERGHGHAVAFDLLEHGGILGGDALACDHDFLLGGFNRGFTHDL